MDVVWVCVPPRPIAHAQGIKVDPVTGALSEVPADEALTEGTEMQKTTMAGGGGGRKAAAGKGKAKKGKGEYAQLARESVADSSDVDSD